MKKNPPAPHLFYILLFGFFSGLPLALSGLTLMQWLTESGVKLALIGLTANIGISYSLKFLFAPILDRPMPLGRRRGWLLVSQVALVAGAVALAASQPATHPLAALSVGAAIAFASSCQDIAIDAWRIETFTPEQMGKALAAYVWGYRIAMLTSGAGAIRLASVLGWHGALLGVAGLMMFAPLLTLMVPEPKVHVAPEGGLEAFVAPLREMLRRPGIWPLLAFVVLFKLGEALASPMVTSFYHAMGFNRNQIADVLGLPYLVAVLLGAAAGGVLVARMGVRRALFTTGFLQMGGMAAYFLLALHPGSLPLLYVKVLVENFAEAMADTCFLSFASAQCRLEFTATQYALLSSLSALALRTVGGLSGLLAAHLGWVGFYGFAIFTALPAMLVMRVWLWNGDAVRQPQAS